MPSPVGHTLGAFSALLALEPDIVTSRYKTNIALGAAFVFGSLADADFVVAHFTTAPYLRHHYFSHSIPFADLFHVALLDYFEMLSISKRWKICGTYWSGV